jgi:hypothetical protein
MRKYHPIWYVRYLIEEFPEICCEILSFLGLIIYLVVDTIVVTIWYGMVLLYSKICNNNEN